MCPIALRLQRTYKMSIGGILDLDLDSALPVVFRIIWITFELTYLERQDLLISETLLGRTTA